MTLHLELLPAALDIMGSGMLGTFSVILLIWGVVSLLNRLTK